MASRSYLSKMSSRPSSTPSLWAWASAASYSLSDMVSLGARSRYFSPGYSEGKIIRFLRFNSNRWGIHGDY